MPAHRSYLVLWITLGVSVTLATLAGVYGIGGDGLTLLLRISARMSFILFLLWLVVPSMQRLNSRTFSGEPHLLMSFAVAHTIHVGVIFFAAFQGYFAQITEGELLKFLFGGGMAYAMIVLMGATAFAPPSRPRALLRTGGGIYVGLVFLNSYLGRVREGEMLSGLGVAGILVAAAINLAAWRAQRTALKARTVSA